MAIINKKKTSPTDWLSCSPNLVARHPENLACDIWIAGMARHRSFPVLGGSFPRVAFSSRTCGSFPRVTPVPAAIADDNVRVCDLDAALTKVGREVPHGLLGQILVEHLPCGRPRGLQQGAMPLCTSHRINPRILVQCALNLVICNLQCAAMKAKQRLAAAAASMAATRRRVEEAC